MTLLVCREPGGGWRRRERWAIDALGSSDVRERPAAARRVRALFVVAYSLGLRSTEPISHPTPAAARCRAGRRPLGWNLPEGTNRCAQDACGAVSACGGVSSFPPLPGGPKPHRDHTAPAFCGFYSVGDYGGMRVPAWLCGPSVSQSVSATLLAWFYRTR